MPRPSRRPTFLLNVLALGAVLAFAIPPALAGSLDDKDVEEMKSGLKAADPQPDAGKLKPGLAVSYHMGRFQTLAEMMGIIGKSEGDKGRPLPMLNYEGAEGTKVMTSDRTDTVGAIIDGFIKFPEPGTYVLKVMSNDGISLDIGGKTVFEDGSVHVTDYSDGLPLKIDTAGWYPLHIRYFQKKGGYALGLYWRTPKGAGNYVVVPAEMYAHLEK
jgi:hypothetical protein